MTSRQECEFYLLRYVPDPVRNEFVHVGVILREAGPGNGSAGGVEGGLEGGSGNPRVALKFTSDWRRVRCLDPEADTEMLEGLESELRRRFEQEPDGNLMHVLEDSFSNSVQVTRAKAYLAESMESGVEELMRMYVEPLKWERVSRLPGRAAIQAQMRMEFERAGVWDLLRKRIAASKYTRAGDPLRIDLGYRNGAVKMFQAVSLDSAVGVDAAKGLAFSADGLRAGVEREEKIPLELTAIVEPIQQRTVDSGQWTGKARRPAAGREEIEGELDPERVEAYRFAVETMEERRIRVLTTADLGRVAETARRELRV